MKKLKMHGEILNDSDFRKILNDSDFGKILNYQGFGFKEDF